MFSYIQNLVNDVSSSGDVNDNYGSYVVVPFAVGYVILCSSSSVDGNRTQTQTSQSFPEIGNTSNPGATWNQPSNSQSPITKVSNGTWPHNRTPSLTSPNQSVSLERIENEV